MQNRTQKPGTGPARKRKRTAGLIVGVKPTAVVQRSNRRENRQNGKHHHSAKAHNLNKSAKIKSPKAGARKVYNRKMKRYNVCYTDDEVHKLLETLPNVPDEELDFTVQPEVAKNSNVRLVTSKVVGVRHAEKPVNTPQNIPTYATIDPAIISVGVKPTLIVEQPATLIRFLARLGLYELSRVDIALEENHRTYENSSLANIRKTIDKKSPINVDTKLYNFLKVHRHTTYENRDVKMEHYRNLAKKYVAITSSTLTMTNQQSAVMTHTISRAVDDSVDVILQQPTLQKNKNKLIKIFRNFLSPQARQLNKVLSKQLF